MQLTNYIAIAQRGECAFTAKAKIAQTGGAVGLLVINDNEGMKRLIWNILLYISC